MDEKIVKELLKRGHMVTPDTLNRIKSVGLESYFSENSGTGTFLKEMKKAEVKKPTLKITVKTADVKTNLNTADVVKVYNNRYSALRNMLSGKIEAISINKTASQFEAAVIGMVKQVSPQGFSIEDPTGSIDVMSRQGVELDDVIGVKGIVREGAIQEKEIVYPDIPLNRQNPRLDVKLPLSVKTESGKSVIVVGNTTKELGLPIWISLEKEGKTSHILVYMPESGVDANLAVKLLKKRHLYPNIKKLASTEDPYIIDPVPDFFWIVGKERWKTIYKGVCVFSTKENESLELDLSTGEFTFS
jgi:DNA polymerase II small subunit/DNA polymerase delta subunit B